LAPDSLASTSRHEDKFLSGFHPMTGYLRKNVLRSAEALAGWKR
jgi:hypothetical protein